MKDRIRELEAECSHLKSTSKDDRVEWPSVIPPYLEEKSAHDSNSTTLPLPVESARGAAASINMIVPSMLRAPEIGPNVPGNSSCQIFVGALQKHLIRDSIGQNRLSKISKHPRSSQEEIAKNYARRLYLDDKALDGARSDRLLVLPEKSYALKMVNKVFHFFAREYGLFSLAEFEARIEETYKNVQDQSLTWLAFLFITLAVGEQYTNKAGSKNKVPGMDFFLTTLRFFHEPIEEPTIDSIRTLLLIAFYSQGLNRMNSVFTYTGLALSTAMILGVHRRASNAGLTELEKEERSKLWWTAFLMDSLWASRLGLPPHFNLDDMDIDFPDEHLKHDQFDPKYLIANTQLALCVGSVMKEVYGISGSSSFIKNTISSLERLEAFFDNLNPELKVIPERITTNRSTENLHLRYNQMIIVTIRPLYLSLIKEGKMCTKLMEEVKLKCIDAALLNVNILNSLYDSGWFSAFGFLEAQCCFSSILILVMETLNGRSFSELPMALSLNKYMCDAGNITAMDNHHRLKDLDRILFEAEKERQRKKEAATENQIPILKKIDDAESERNTINDNHQHHTPPVKEENEQKERAQESISSGQDSNLPFLLDLDSSGIGFEQFSPNTLYNLSTTFQKWDSAPIYPDQNNL